MSKQRSGTMETATTLINYLNSIVATVREIDPRSREGYSEMVREQMTQ